MEQLLKKAKATSKHPIQLRDNVLSNFLVLRAVESLVLFTCILSVPTLNFPEHYILKCWLLSSSFREWLFHCPSLALCLERVISSLLILWCSKNFLILGLLILCSCCHQNTDLGDMVSSPKNNSGFPPAHSETAKQMNSLSWAEMKQFLVWSSYLICIATTNTPL